MISYVKRHNWYAKTHVAAAFATATDLGVLFTYVSRRISKNVRTMDPMVSLQAVRML